MENDPEYFISKKDSKGLYSFLVRNPSSIPYFYSTRIAKSIMDANMSEIFYYLWNKNYQFQDPDELFRHAIRLPFANFAVLLMKKGITRNMQANCLSYILLNGNRLNPAIATELVFAAIAQFRTPITPEILLMSSNALTEILVKDFTKTEDIADAILMSDRILTSLKALPIEKSMEVLLWIVIRLSSNPRGIAKINEILDNENITLDYRFFSSIMDNAPLISSDMIKALAHNLKVINAGGVALIQWYTNVW